MNWRDFYRYTSFLLGFCVLDVIGHGLFGWRPSLLANIVLAAMCTTIWAVREDRA